MKQSYRLDELSEAWQKSYWSLIRMIKRGELKAFKVGATWRVSEAERSRIEKKFATVSSVGASY